MSASISRARRECDSATGDPVTLPRMGDLDGKVVLITGANTGIGRATAEALAARGARIILACRSAEKTKPVLDAIAAAGGKADFVALDLADLDSVRACAEAVLAKDEPLHVLINNAGLAGLKGLTKQGFEITFGTNHLGHFLLTELLLPRLRASAPSRIVNVASGSHYQAKGIDWDALRKPTAHLTGMPEYEVSKLANVLFTKELARGRAGKGVHSYALHPGVVASDAWRQMPWPIRPIAKLFMLSNEEGAQTTIYCAASTDVADDDGLFYDKCKQRKPNVLAEDEALAKKRGRRARSGRTRRPELDREVDVDREVNVDREVERQRRSRSQPRPRTRSRPQRRSRPPLTRRTCPRTARGASPDPPDPATFPGRASSMRARTESAASSFRTRRTCARAPLGRSRTSCTG